MQRTAAIAMIWTFGGLIKQIPTGHSTVGAMDVDKGGCCDDAA